MKCPEPDQCSNHEKVFEDEDHVGYAIWYPQMGGYVGRAVAVLDKKWEQGDSWSSGGCVDVYVWHDGEFPFADDGSSPYAHKTGHAPVRLHHCNPQQFIDFGAKLLELNEQGRIAT